MKINIISATKSLHVITTHLATSALVVGITTTAVGQTFIPASLAAPDGSVDSSSSGFTVKAFAFLELKAGMNRFGVNSDDGFRVTFGVATNPKDVFAVQPAGAVFGSSRGATDTEWEIEVESDGIYPVRLITWDGGGGACFLEFPVTRISVSLPKTVSISLMPPSPGH